MGKSKINKINQYSTIYQNREGKRISGLDCKTTWKIIRDHNFWVNYCKSRTLYLMNIPRQVRILWRSVWSLPWIQTTIYPININLMISCSWVSNRVSNRNSVACNCSRIARICAELRGVYSARNCAQVKSTCVGNPSLKSQNVFCLNYLCITIFWRI